MRDRVQKRWRDALVWAVFWFCLGMLHVLAVPEYYGLAVCE